MTKEQLNDWVNTGREIEFTYQKREYSITYFKKAENEYWISFCEYYQTPLDVPTIDQLWNSTYQNIPFSEMWSSLRDDDVSVF